MSYTNKRDEPWRQDKNMALQRYLLKINEREKLMDKSAFAVVRKLEEMEQRATMLSLRFEKLEVLKEQYFQMAKKQLLEGSTYEMLPNNVLSQQINETARKQSEQFPKDMFHLPLRKRVSFDEGHEATSFQEKSVHRYTLVTSLLDNSISNNNPSSELVTRPNCKAIWTQTESLFPCHCGSKLDSRETIPMEKNNSDAVSNENKLNDPTVTYSPKKPPRMKHADSFPAKNIIEQDCLPLSTDYESQFSVQSRDISNDKSNLYPYAVGVDHNPAYNNQQLTATENYSITSQSHASGLISFAKKQKSNTIDEDLNLKESTNCNLNGKTSFPDVKNSAYFLHSTPKKGTSHVNFIPHSGLTLESLNENENLYNPNDKFVNSVENDKSIHLSSSINPDKKEFKTRKSISEIKESMPGSYNCNYDDKEFFLEQKEAINSAQQELGSIENQRRNSQNSVLNMSENFHTDQVIDDLQIKSCSKDILNTNKNIDESSVTSTRDILQKSLVNEKSVVDKISSKVIHSSVSSSDYKEGMEIEGKRKTRSKKVASKKNIGSYTPSIHSEDSSVPTDSEDSFFIKDIPLTSTAAYQNMLSTVPVPQASQPLSDSESEDEIENAFAKAVINSPHRISEPSAKLEVESADINKSSKDFSKSGIQPTESSRKQSLIPSSVSRSKLSKATRKVLGMDSDSDVAPAIISVKKAKDQEDSDEFDFYD